MTEAESALVCTGPETVAGNLGINVGNGWLHCSLLDSSYQAELQPLSRVRGFMSVWAYTCLYIPKMI